MSHFLLQVPSHKAGGCSRPGAGAGASIVLEQSDVEITRSCEAAFHKLCHSFPVSAPIRSNNNQQKQNNCWVTQPSLSRSSYKEVHVRLGDMNDHSPVFEREEFEVRVSESALVNTPVTQLKVGQCGSRVPPIVTLRAPRRVSAVLSDTLEAAR